MNLNFRINPFLNKQQLPVHIDSSRTVNMDICNTFQIDSFKLNSLIEIIYIDNEKRTHYLSASADSNEIIFEPDEDGSGRQKWIIENEPDDPMICYIKTAYYHKMNVKYIGCPNKSGLAYLYTSKNIYTQWSIQYLGELNYQLRYTGEKFNPSEVNLVVSRFLEPINWVMAYNDIAVVYNKGNAIFGFNRIINIENVGREGHTYLYHIKQNYKELANTTIFIQADPFAHNPTILFGIDNYFRFDPLQPLGLRYLKDWNLPPNEYIKANKTVTDYGLEYLKNVANGNLICDGFHDVGMIEIRKDVDKLYPECRNRTVVEGFLSRAKFPFRSTIKQISFTFCALFAVHRNRILHYRVEVFQNLLNELIRKNNQGGVNGYILEKTWLYIFDNNGSPAC